MPGTETRIGYSAKKALVPSLLPPHYTPNILVREGDDSLNAEGNKSCLMTIDTRASVTITRPNITAGLPERELTGPYILQMTSGGDLLSLEGSINRIYPGMVLPDNLSVCVTRITNEMILVLDVPTVYLWTCGTMCCNWVRKKCHCGVLGHEHILPFM
jgi:hypothetical protein